VHGLDVVLVSGDACALRGDVHDIDEVGIVGLFDGGRNGKVVHAEDIRDAGRKDGEGAEHEDVGIDIGYGVGDNALHDGGEVVSDGLGEGRERGFGGDFLKFLKWGF